MLDYPSVLVSSPEVHAVTNPVNRLRVLHVHSGNLYGGVETMLLTQVRHQHTCPGLQFEFALCFSARFRDELIAGGAAVHDLGAVRLRDPLSVRRARRNLKQLLRREKFDAIVTHSCWTQTVFGRSLRAAGIPLVFYLHAPPNGRHWLERLASRTRPDLIIANSKFTAANGVPIFPEIEPHIIYYPIAAPTKDHSNGTRKRLRVSLQTPEEATVIIQVSRMEHCKGQAMHLEALAQLKDSPNWVCWQVGGAQRSSEISYLSALKRRAAELGISDRVRFLNERTDIAELMGAADIYCQPNSDPDSFGITFIEALYAGLPVITCDIGGPREIVDYTCGVVIPPGDVSKLASALRRLIESPTERFRLGQAGPSRATGLCEPSRQLKGFYAALEPLLRPTRLGVNEGAPPQCLPRG